MVTICKTTGKIANEYCSEKEEKSFITREHEPAIKPADWSYMLPKETCTEHNAETKKKENEVEIYNEKNKLNNDKKTNTTNKTNTSDKKTTSTTNKTNTKKEN